VERVVKAFCIGVGVIWDRIPLQDDPRREGLGNRITLFSVCTNEHHRRSSINNDNP
jgi:hypothetical protein